MSGWIRIAPSVLGVDLIRALRERAEAAR